MSTGLLTVFSRDSRLLINCVLSLSGEEAALTKRKLQSLTQGRLSPRVPVDRGAFGVAPFRGVRLVGKPQDTRRDGAVHGRHVGIIDLFPFVAERMIVRIFEGDRDGVRDDAVLRERKVVAAI